MGFCKQIMVGRLGGDPEIRFSGDGKAFGNIRLATDYWDSKEKAKKTLWTNVVLFGKHAENAAKFLKKGSEVYIDGEVVERSYEKNGQTITNREVKASDMRFVGGGNGGGNGGAKSGGGDFTPSADDSDTIPF